MVRATRGSRLAALALCPPIEELREGLGRGAAGAMERRWFPPFYCLACAGCGLASHGGSTLSQGRRADHGDALDGCESMHRALKYRIVPAAGVWPLTNHPPPPPPSTSALPA